MLVRSPVRARRRRGALLVEAAIVYFLFLLLLLGWFVLGLGLFRSQEIAHMARESARWASLQSPEGRTQTQLKSHLAGLPPFGVDPAAVVIVGPTTMGDMVLVTIRFPWTPEAFFTPVVLEKTARARISD